MNDAQRLPVFPLNTVLYPGGPLPLRIFEPRYVDMVGKCMRNTSPFVVTSLSKGSETGEATFNDVGSLASVIDFQQMPDGLLGILVKGGQRVRITDTDRQPDGLYTAKAEPLPVEPAVSLPQEFDDLVTLLRQLLEQIPEQYYPADERAFEDAGWVSFRLAELLPLGLSQKQYFLEMDDAVRRLEVVRPLLESMQTPPQS